MITSSPYKRNLEEQIKTSTSSKKKCIKKSYTKKTTNTITNKKQTLNKNKKMYSCVICSEIIDDDIESSIECASCKRWCHDLCVDIDTFIKCDLCI